MAESSDTQTFTVVAFRYDQKNSVLYRNNYSVQTIARTVEEALDKYKVDVISIRRVYEKCSTQA